MTITDTIKYIGVNDHEVDLFEGQYVVPNGMAYNSYVVIDDKIAVFEEKIQKLKLATQKDLWKSNKQCQHCGGSFKGLFVKTCRQCGKRKDY